MKKFLFAAQVFGIMMMFPLYVILEMNHGTASLDENKNHPLVNASTEKPSVLISAHSEAEGENSIRVQYVWAQQLTLEK